MLDSGYSVCWPKATSAESILFLQCVLLQNHVLHTRLFLKQSKNNEKSPKRKSSKTNSPSAMEMKRIVLTLS